MKEKICIALALLAGAQAANAGGDYVGLVRPVHMGAGYLYLEVSATQMSGRPACATRNYVRLQEAYTDSAFKEKFAMILGAWLAEKPMHLGGIGTCSSEGDEYIQTVTFP